MLQKVNIAFALRLLTGRVVGANRCPPQAHQRCDPHAARVNAQNTRISGGSLFQGRANHEKDFTSIGSGGTGSRCERMRRLSQSLRLQGKTNGYAGHHAICTKLHARLRRLWLVNAGDLRHRPRGDVCSAACVRNVSDDGPGTNAGWQRYALSISLSDPSQAQSPIQWLRPLIRIFNSKHVVLRSLSSAGFGVRMLGFDRELGSTIIPPYGL